MSLAEVLRAGLASAKRPQLSAHHWKVLNVLLACRTPQLGGHRYRCERCGGEHFVPRSCGNRHCPNCQWHQAVEWLERQEELLLPILYFHVVFTLPHVLNPLIEQNRTAFYNLLLGAAAQTLLEFGRNNLGVQLGLTVILHTWSQTLFGHYHVHCIVTGGGLALDGSGWRRSGEKFLFAVTAMAKVFQGKFCAELQRLYADKELQFHGQLSALAQEPAFAAVIREATAKSWNVYAKRPFAGPGQVLRYLSRYTHRVAISQRRLLALNTARGTVKFAYKLRRDPVAPLWTDMELEVGEFVRRFCLHILPERFVKIRHYGLLANRGRQERVAQARMLLGVDQNPPQPADRAEPPWTGGGWRRRGAVAPVDLSPLWSAHVSFSRDPPRSRERSASAAMSPRKPLSQCTVAKPPGGGVGWFCPRTGGMNAGPAASTLRTLVRPIGEAGRDVLLCPAPAAHPWGWSLCVAFTTGQADTFPH